MIEAADPTLAAKVIAAARGWIGTPYRHQASLRHVGADCLGLVRGVYREIYAREPETPPPYAADWAAASGVESLADAARRHLREVAIDELSAGDVALFRWRQATPARHAGIMSSACAMIHAQSGVHVCEIPVSPWWRRRLAFAFRFPGCN
jgi:NlpC/P60 family putative phage cell wall peptidase